MSWGVGGGGGDGKGGGVLQGSTCSHNRTSRSEGCEASCNMKLLLVMNY